MLGKSSHRIKQVCQESNKKLSIHAYTVPDTNLQWVPPTAAPITLGEMGPQPSLPSLPPLPGREAFRHITGALHVPPR